MSQWAVMTLGPPSSNSGLTLADSQNAPPIWPETVQAGNLVAMLQKHLEQLRRQSCHGNQKLFLDDVFIAYLLAFFNPTIRSLRTIEDFGQTKLGQKHLSTTRICKSTLSDFNQMTDPEPL